MAKFNEASKIIKDMEATEKAVGGMVTVMGVLAVNHFKKSFIDEGFTDYDLQKWQKRKRIRGNEGRAVLTKTGNLRRSLRYVKISRIAVRISSNLRYAKIHNEGGEIHKKERSHVLNFNKKGGLQKQRTERQRSKTSFSQKVTIGKHKIKMPKRQFVGYSSQLSGKIEMRLDKKIRAIFK